MWDIQVLLEQICVRKHFFEKVYNSKNISDAYDTKPDILVLRRFKSRKNLLQINFLKKILKIFLKQSKNIKKINPKFIVLISTIDVYNSPVNVSEDTLIDFEKLEPYGKKQTVFRKMGRRKYR